MDLTREATILDWIIALGSLAIVAAIAAQLIV